MRTPGGAHRPVTNDGSKGMMVRTGPPNRSTALRRTAAILVAVGAIALVWATFATVVRVRVGEAGVQVLDRLGWDRHGPLLLLAAVAAVPLLAAALRGTRWGAPALALGLAAVVLVVAGDAPALGDTGEAGRVYAGSEARAGPRLVPRDAGRRRAAAGRRPADARRLAGGRRGPVRGRRTPARGRRPETAKLWGDYQR